MLGLDAHRMAADRLTIAAGVTVCRGTVAVLERLQKIARNLGSIDVNGSVLLGKKHPLAADQIQETQKLVGRQLKRLEEVPQHPKPRSADRLLEAIGQEEFGQVAVEAPRTVGR